MLRRRSSLIILGVVVVMPGIFVPLGLLSFLDEPKGDHLAIAAFSLGCIALVWRIMGAKVVLTVDTMIVVNPVFSYEVGYHGVWRVGGDSRGTLTVWTFTDEEISSFGFSGSILDHFVRTSDRAAERIQRRLPVKKREVRKGERGRRELEEKYGVRRSISRAWGADACALTSMVLWIWAGVLGIG